MASLVSGIGFSLPVASSWPASSFLKERTPRKLALTSPSRQLNYRTATLLLAFYDLTDAVKNPNRIPRPRHLTPQREVVTCHTNVGFCSTHDVFSGYWVGPDDEDGWGFVEAFVNRI